MAARAVLLLFALTLVGCVSSSDEVLVTQPEVVAQNSDARVSYRLRARDFVKVGVINEADTFVERRINTDGTIDVPFLGKDSLVAIAGMTVSEAQAALAARYVQFFKSPVVSLEIRGYAERRIYVDGSVGRTGAVTIPPEENITLKKALAAAGGILRGGNRSAVVLRRKLPDGSLKTRIIDVRAIDSGEQPDIPLFDDDYIFVRESRI
jgi:protein involved in polysaccharide export with SLBB domain